MSALDKEIQIDINCDLGECSTSAALEEELKLLPFISSVNISCGFHAGSKDLIQKVVENAVQRKLRIGAHPSYPDRAGFGRRSMDVSGNELKDLLNIQISYLNQVVESAGSRISYVKPHGALYHDMMSHEEKVMPLLEILAERRLSLMGLPDSKAEISARQKGVEFIREGFIDRKYSSDGNLISRDTSGAIIKDTEDALLQCLLMVKDGQVKTDGEMLDISVESVCIHGDNSAAKPILKVLREKLPEHGISIVRHA